MGVGVDDGGCFFVLHGGNSQAKRKRGFSGSALLRDYSNCLHVYTYRIIEVGKTRGIRVDLSLIHI